MTRKADLDAVYVPSEDVVAREIEDEIIIVPLTAGIADMEDELYTLNETGRTIWKRLDGTKNLQEVVEELSREYEAVPDEIEEDVMGLVAELLERKIIIGKKRT